jgi:hypothetical protein
MRPAMGELREKVLSIIDHAYGLYSSAPTIDVADRILALVAEDRRELVEALWDGVIDAASKITMADGRKLSDWATLMNLLRDGYNSALAKGGKG